MRIGIGYDFHRLVEGRSLYLGGVEIPHEKGLLGHSDGEAFWAIPMEMCLFTPSVMPFSAQWP